MVGAVTTVPATLQVYLQSKCPGASRIIFRTSEYKNDSFPRTTSVAFFQTRLTCQHLLFEGVYHANAYFLMRLACQLLFFKFAYNVAARVGPRCNMLDVDIVFCFVTVHKTCSSAQLPTLRKHIGQPAHSG